MYTQLNQYHVILEADPDFQTDPEMLNKIYIQALGRSGARDNFLRRFGVGFGGLECDHGVGALYALLRDFHAASSMPGLGRHFEPDLARPTSPPAGRASNAVPLSAFAHMTQGHEIAVDQPSGAVPLGDGVVQSGPERLAGRCHYRHR